MGAAVYWNIQKSMKMKYIGQKQSLHNEWAWRSIFGVTTMILRQAWTILAKLSCNFLKLSSRIVFQVFGKKFKPFCWILGQNLMDGTFLPSELANTRVEMQPQAMT